MSPWLDAVVVVPARDEEELIGGCIRALAAQRGVDPKRWRVILVLDGCTDETRALALAAAAEGGPEVELLELEPVGVGAARARGMDLGCTLLERAGNPSGLIATTDADSRVAPDWLVRQLAAVAEGARAIGGRVALEAADATFLGDATISRRRREHEERIARVRGQGPTEHPHFAGASIGITADAYRAIGGFEPLAALEDEDLGRRLSAGGVTIHRLDSVRVTTSGRTIGRAPRGLARDLAVSEWHSRRTFDGFAYDVAEVARARDRSVSVIVPAKDCAETIGPIVSALDALREAGLLDELIVVDADSADGTAERAAEAGAEVLSESGLLPRLGPCRGKGDAMYRAASSCSGELIAFVDADTAGFDSTLLSGLLGPVLRGSFAAAGQGGVPTSVQRPGGGDRGRRRKSDRTRRQAAVEPPLPRAGRVRAAARRRDGDRALAVRGAFGAGRLRGGDRDADRRLAPRRDGCPGPVSARRAAQPAPAAAIAQPDGLRGDRRGAAASRRHAGTAGGTAARGRRAR